MTLADERARQQGTQTSTYTGAPVLDPTDERGWETERCRMAQATAPILDSTIFETPTDVRYMAAFWGNADISQRLPDNRDL